jgi:hypothetical protein
MKTDDRKALVVVGEGRGFVIEAGERRLIITAAHCLPNYPPRASISSTWERTYKDLLGAIGESPTVWAECLFLDPVADIAVLGTPDTQDLSQQAEHFDQLIEKSIPLRVSEVAGEKVEAWLMPLDDGPPIGCEVFARQGTLWTEKPKRQIKGGMSGSPILLDGSAVGVLVTTHGPHPGFYSHLPGWLLRDLGVLPDLNAK